MNKLADLASSADPGLEELLWDNRNVFPRLLSTNPSCSFQPPRDQTKSLGDIYRTKRPMLGAVDSILGDSCLSSLEPTAKRNTPQQDNHGPELSLGLFDSHFSMLMDTEDKHLREPHVVPVYKEGNRRSNNSSIFVDGFPELTTARNTGEPRQSSMETWADHVSKQLLIMHSQTPTPPTGLTDSKLQKVNSGSDKCLTVPNFPFFHRSATLGKGNVQVICATRPTSGSIPLVPEQSKSNYVKPTEGGGDLFELPLMEKNCDSKSQRGFQKRLDPKATTQEPISPVKNPRELSPPPDEQSEAVVPKCFTRRKRWPDQAPALASGLAKNTIKGKPDARKCVDQDATTTSSSSRRASNDVKSLTKRCECTERTAYRREDFKKQVNKTTQPGRGSAGAKKRTKEGHKLSERRRRDKINKKISKLQKLIPYCDKVDKASILDDAIRYLKALQLQAQIMSMGTGITCMPPVMLPTGMQPIQAPHSAHLSPMGMRMNLGFGYNTAPFPTSTIPGLQGLMLNQSVPIAPFFPFNESYFANIPGRVTSEELRTSAPFSSFNNVAPGDQNLFGQPGHIQNW